jgi:hypothetical protein
MVLGGVMLRSDLAATLEPAIGAWRQRRRLFVEIGWKKTTEQKLDRFMEFTSGIFRYAHSGEITIACAVFDREHNHLYKGQRKAESRRVRAAMFLVNCFCLRTMPRDTVHVFPDKDFVPCVPQQYIKVLNAMHATRRGSYGGAIVETYEPLTSHDSSFVQMSDVVAGAVASCNNRNHDPSKGRGAAKQTLMEHVSELAKVPLTGSSPRACSWFDLWFVQPTQIVAQTKIKNAVEPDYLDSAKYRRLHGEH